MVKLLLAIDRRTTIEDAFDTVRLAEKLQQEDTEKIIVGIDLSGDPNVSHSYKLNSVFNLLQVNYIFEKFECYFHNFDESFEVSMFLV